MAGPAPVQNWFPVIDGGRARGYFNDIATHYNTRLVIVPDRFLSRSGAFTPQP